ncbi:hypothetical protein P2C75_01160 [Xanthomonas perforans]
MLDEPTHHLDLASVEAIEALLQAQPLQEGGIMRGDDQRPLMATQQRLDTAQAQ